VIQPSKPSNKLSKLATLTHKNTCSIQSNCYAQRYMAVITKRCPLHQLPRFWFIIAQSAQDKTRLDEYAKSSNYHPRPSLPYPDPISTSSKSTTCSSLLKLYMRRSQSSLPVHILLSLNPIHVTGPAWPVKVLSHLPVLESHTFTVRSSAPETTRSVSPARAHTPSTCPKKVFRHLPVCTSHRRTVESSAPVSM